ncbi:MAG: T9SS type A sorting domain-containing protein, partial [Saprospiraceae bacterium]
GEGGWGAELRTPDDNKPWTVASAEINQFKWIFVDQNNIEIRTIQTDNEAAVIAKTDMDSKFSIPTGIDVWNPAASSAPSGIMSYSNGVMILSNPTDTNPMIDLGGNQDLPNGTNITLNAGAGFDSYAWNTGETTQSITISTIGTYEVTVVDNGCLKTGSMTAETPVSISELEELGVDFEVSPNPAKDFIRVQVSSTENKNFNLSLIANNGQIIINKELNSVQEEQVEFNLKSLPTGIYFMVLEHNGKRSTQKFVISK